MSLSSAESETYAAASAVMDAILIKDHFVLGTPSSNPHVSPPGFFSWKGSSLTSGCWSFEPSQLKGTLAPESCD